MSNPLEALGHLQPTVAVPPLVIDSKNPGRAPTTSDINYPIGQEWIYNLNEYILVAKSAGVAIWVVGGSVVVPATLTNHALVVGSGAAPMRALPVMTNGQLPIGSTGADPVPGSITSSNSSITVTSGAGTLALTVTQATTTQLGGSTLATGAEAVTGTDASKLITPSTLTSRLAAPGTIGGTTPGAGHFTTLDTTTTITAGTTLTATLGAITATNGNFVKGTAGNKDVYNSVATTTTAGANSAGTVTLVGGTATVATTAVTASSKIRWARQGIGATGAAALGHVTIGTISAGVSFVINSVQAADATALQASDVSSIWWEIVN